MYGKNCAEPAPPPPPPPAVTVRQVRDAIKAHRDVAGRLEALRAMGAAPLLLRRCPGKVGRTFELPDGLYIQVESGRRNYMEEGATATAVRVARNRNDLTNKTNDNKQTHPGASSKA